MSQVTSYIIAGAVVAVALVTAYICGKDRKNEK